MFKTSNDISHILNLNPVPSSFIMLLPEPVGLLF